VLVASLAQSALVGQSMVLLTGLLCLFSIAGFGQCTVTTDQAGRLVTICTDYASRSGFLMNRPDQSQAQETTVYAGSPYLSFPVYEAGIIEFTATRQRISCQLALNLVTNQVLCRFNNDSVEYAILPDSFTVGNRRFVGKASPKGERVYYMVLYAGKSRLLTQTRATLQVTKREPYALDEQFDGTYIRQERYFIERGNTMREITLSRKSVLKALGSPLSPSSPTKDKLTVQEMIGLVASHEGFQ
jgi:hypothetical protein